jgi:hypothetical protein
MTLVRPRQWADAAFRRQGPAVTSEIKLQNLLISGFEIKFQNRIWAILRRLIASWRGVFMLWSTGMV